MKNKKNTVFIVDTNLLNIDIIKSEFSTYNFKFVGSATSEDEALKKINELEPDLVFISENLSNITGEELILKINPTLFESKTNIVLIDNKKLFLKLYFLHKYRVIDIVTSPITNDELNDINKSFDEIKKYYLDILNDTNYIKREEKNKEYNYVKHINYSKYFSKYDFKLINKLGIDIEPNNLYTEYDHEIIEMQLIIFCDQATYTNGKKFHQEEI